VEKKILPPLGWLKFVKWSFPNYREIVKGDGIKIAPLNPVYPGFNGAKIFRGYLKQNQFPTG